MSEEVYSKKLADLQQYIPFMENMIAQLKDPKWKPREAQLNKMESLYNMITDKNKKWKYETLLKCEEVILKLQTKVKGSKSLSNQIEPKTSNKEQLVTTAVNEIMNVLKFNSARARLHKIQETNETPKSPSPTPEVGIPFEPKIIPIEPTTSQESQMKFNIIDPNELSSTWDKNLERYTKEKPDIYSSAAQSLVQKKTVFDRLGPVIGDPQKPLLTDDDLAQLSTGTEDLYKDLTKQKTKSDLKIELNLKITPRIVPVPCSKPKSLKVEEKTDTKDKNQKEIKVKTVKVDGNLQGDIFGSLLSSIDTKILEETKKKDHKKDHHSKHREDKNKILKKSHKSEKTEKTDSKTEKKEEKTQEDYVSSTVDIPMEKPKRLADKYHPKPRLKQPTEEVGSTSRSEEKDEQRFNRDPRRRSPPLSMGLFNQNLQNEDRTQRTHTIPSFDPNFDGRVETPWNFTRTPEHRYPLYNANNLGFPQEQLPTPSVRFEPPVLKFEPPSRFEPPPPSGHFDHQRHFDHTAKRFEPRIDPVPYNQPVVVAQSAFIPPILPTQLQQPPQQVPQFHRKSFNPFEPLNSEKEKEEVESNFNKRDSPYNRYNFGNRSKFDRSRFERQRNERFDRRERFTGAKPFGQRRSLDDDDHKKSESSPSETFTSPLESLYSSNIVVSRGKSSLDKFKIPKKKQEEKKEEVTKEEEKIEVKEDSEEDSLLSRKVKRRSRLKIEDSDEEGKKSPETKNTEIEKSKGEKAKDVDKLKSKKVKPKVENIENPKGEIDNQKVDKEGNKEVDKEGNKEVDKEGNKEVNKEGNKDVDKEISKEVNKEGKKEVNEEVIKEEKKSRKSELLEEIVDIDSPRKLRARPRRALKPSEIPEERKSPTRRSRRVTRSTKHYTEVSKDSGEENEEIEGENIKVEDETAKKEIDEKAEGEKTKAKGGEEGVNVENQERKIKEEKEEEDKILTQPSKSNDGEVLQKEVKIEAGSSSEGNEVVPEKEKVKNELLADIKKTNLKMEETDVLQFILQNYKKIKKIFKSDSSSEDEDETKKKKEKKRPEKSDDSPSTKPPPEEIKEPGTEEKKEKEEVIKAAEIKQVISTTKEQFVSSDEVKEKNVMEIKEGVKIEEKTKIEKKIECEEVVNKRKMTRRRNRKIQAQQTVSQINSKSVKKVIVKKMSGGRNTRLAAKSKRARRSELDKLHDDIKEMMMGGQIMTTSGKRSCTISQRDERTEEKMEENSDEEKTDVPKTNLKVMLEKTDLEKIANRKEGEEDLPPPVLEKMVVTPPPNDERKKVVKRKSKWASGIIQKKARKRSFNNKPGGGEKDEEEEEEEDYEISEIVEHDKKYFYVQAAKIGCKLCGFKGKLIVQHYRTSHPESEVLISRLEPGISEILISDSVRRKEEYDKVYTDFKSFKIMFKCPFCLLVLKDTPGRFYNHLCSHTGEYRFGCLQCPYRTFNLCNVRTHLSQSHSRTTKFEYKTLYPDPKVTKYVYGHLCSECNFVQLIRGTVEEHAMVYHPGTPEIHRINMGALLQETVQEKPRSSNLDNCINAVASGAGNIYNKHQRIPAEVKELNVSDLLSQIEEFEKVEGGSEKMESGKVEGESEKVEGEIKIKTEPPEPKEIEEVTQPIELAAFMCDTDLDMENNMGDDREKMSQWINENTRKARTSIADRLQIRLVSDDENKEDENGGEEKEIEVENNEMAEDPLEGSSTSIEDETHQEINSPCSPPIEVLSVEILNEDQKSPVPIEKKKPPELTGNITKNITAMSLRKENYSVSQIINRLQEKLTVLTPKKPQNPLTNTLEIGPIRVVKSSSTFTFFCRVPNCKYITNDEKSFQKHSEILHKDFVYVFNTGKCDLCSIKFEYEGKFVSVHDVFLHMMSAHKNFFKDESDHITFKLPHEVPNVLSQGSENAGPKFPFVITNVTSLATQNVGLPPPPPLLPLQIVNPEKSIQEDPEIKLPVITSVKSLAPKPKPITTKYLAKHRYVLRDIPMKAQEKTNKKSPKAIAALMKPLALNALYKCPDYDCCYSTMIATSFRKHLTEHPTLKNTLVPCLYCDYKVVCNFYVIHLEIRHGHCKFGCGDCFYRATNAYFVMLHRQMEHPNSASNYIELKVMSYTNKASNEIVPAKLDDLILTYNCEGDGNSDCSFKTLFFDEYLKHIEGVHQVNRMERGKAIMESWLERDIGPFQCKYCKKATVTYQEMGRHQASVHFQKDCCFYFRKFLPQGSVVLPEQINLEDPSFINHLIQLPDQVDLCNVKDSKLFATSSSAPEPEQKVIDLEVDTEQVVKDPEPEPVKISLLDEPEILTVEDDVSLLDESDPLCLEDTDDKMPAAELTGKALYKCNCGKAYDTMIELKPHISECVNKPYKCVHCGKERKSVLGLIQHYREHGRKRFKCSLCIFKHWQQEAVRNHMRAVHNVTCAVALSTSSFTSKKSDPDSDDYVLRPRQTAKSINDINLKVSNVTTEQSSSTLNINLKMTFGPDDVSKLPRQPIYPQPVKCAMCDYETKVKTNMERHLQMHVTQNSVPESAPVNPVPCLDKNEKMFDKMVNLASSSHVGGRMGGMGTKSEKVEDRVPSFVSTNNRYVCGAENCKYQCLEEAMLRRHIMAFHSTETTYKCIHCNINLIEEKTINVDLVLKHLKLHDAHLYRCSSCSFMHNLKHKVERHLVDKHPEKPQNLVVIREVKDSSSEDIVHEKERPWRCGICKFRCSYLPEIKNHVETKHNIDAKYKCALCPVGSDTVEDFTNHFNVNHEGQAVDFIVSYYKEGEAKSSKSESEEVFNTTPLWQRNKSVKHIRGILLDESTSKIPVKRKIGKVKRLENDNVVSLIDDDLGEQEGKVWKKRKVKQVHKEDTEDVIMIDDDDFEGKKLKLDEVDKGKKQDVSIVDLTESKPHPLGDSPKNDKEINSNELIPESKVDESMEVDIDTTFDLSDQESLEKTIELSLERTTSILEDLDKSILLDEVETATVSSEKNSDVEIVQVDEAKSNEENEKSTRLQRTAKIRAFQNIATTNSESIQNFKIFEKKPRSRKKFKSNEFIELSDEEKMNLTVEDVEKMSKEELLEGNLIGTYGPYGIPWEGKMKCPLCEKFISKDENEFKCHLYEELQCTPPYKCKFCYVSATSEEIIEKHTAEEHNNRGFTIRPVEEQIEGWVRTTIAVQSRIIRLEEKSQSIGNFSCLFCNYRSRKTDLGHKHLSRHFIEKPFKCNHCGRGALTWMSMKKHATIASYCRTLGESITSLDPSKGFLISPYLKNMKKIFDQEESKSESDNLIKCHVCSFSGTVEQQIEHSKAEHPSETSRIYCYKCNICSESFVTLLTIMNHFFMEHPGLETSFAIDDGKSKEEKFNCEECKVNFDDEEQLKAHISTHSNILRCVYCPQEFNVCQKIVAHIETKHPGKEVVFRFVGGDLLENIEAILKGGNRESTVTKKKVTKVRDRTNSPNLIENSSSSSVLFIDDST